MTSRSERDAAGPLCLFLCGDVMSGRGIDQILPHPGRPELCESYMRDARGYVELAEKVNGAIPGQVQWDYIWGDALEALRMAEVDLRIINLETSITRSGSFWPDKGIHYRMHPANAACFTAAQIDCCCLANNHVLDFGYDGLAETLLTLDSAGIPHPGAGNNASEAAAPAVLEVPNKGRVLVFAFGSTTSGVPPEWRAAEDRPGINLLEDLSERTAREIAGIMRGSRRPGDVLIASIHWGSNWGYRTPAAQVRFAHTLVDEGIDIVHGHSSHHVRALEVYRDRLILYGCGDLITDYEGIAGYESYRGDLSLLYLVKLEEGRLAELRVVPMQTRRFQLRRASVADAQWLFELLNRLGTPSRVRPQLQGDGSMIFDWR